jgi:hypothetical protein
MTQVSAIAFEPEVVSKCALCRLKGHLEAVLTIEIVALVVEK